MMRKFLLTMLASLALLMTHAAWAQVGTVTHLSGMLTARHADGTTTVLAVKSSILQGDTLITQSDTYTRVKFVDSAEVVLRPGTQMEVSSYLYNEAQPEKSNVVLSLLKGGLRAVTGLIGKANHDAVNFNTPTATIGIRGTHFGALFCQADCGGVVAADGKAPPDGLHIDVVQGAILVKNNGGEQVFAAGQFGYVANPSAPPVIVPPSQGVQVTMPLSISRNAPTVQTAAASKGDGCLVQ
ncbi:FecR domain-containing protein [Herbaspirillum sp. RTI4]|uniref:FecR family protein n=1 Tax=Herbaspirillum sp. RTI4 TaxID=3048640 RepID=UPI002AB49CA2|nr:FecR domain-containing protein [Herbaspirillum sp. RTI4]MDY7578471.1 FecR domain-containing protein [Herbaspirillum sp. RTI4]MEA9981500.1 FecR domain-containing protein [Herbaspirillum sp. RTI4]